MTERNEMAGTSVSYASLGLGALVSKLIDEFGWSGNRDIEADIALSLNPGKWIRMNGLEIRRDGESYSIRKK